MENPEVQTVVSDQLKYTKKSFSHPKYKLHNIYPLSGLQETTVTSSGGQEIIFQLPVKCMNLSESFINFDITLAVGLTAAQQKTIWKNLTPLSLIRQIQLYTQSGVYLADIYYLNKYMNTVFYPETSEKTFSTFPNLVAGSDDTYANLANFYTYETHATTSTVSNTHAYENKVITDSTGANPSLVLISSSKERQHFFPGVQSGVGAAPDSMVYKIQFPMKYVYNSIFNLDKDLYFGEVLQLRIVFDSKDACGLVSLSQTSPITSATSLNDILLKNISFYLAIEQDLNIANQIISKVNTTGMVVPIPYIYSYKQNPGTGNNHSLSLRFNTAHGKKLRRIYYAPFNNDETLVYAFDRSNQNGTTGVKEFYTLLNNERLQEFNVTTVDAKDFMIISNKIKESAVVSLGFYRSSWFWCDDFTSEKELHSRESQDITLSSGVDLSSEQKYDIYVTNNASRAYNHYNFAITEKELMIRPGQIVVQ